LFWSFQPGKNFSAITAQYVTGYYAGDNNTGALPSFSCSIISWNWMWLDISPFLSA